MTEPNDMTDNQLRILKEIRRRRRELTLENTREFRAQMRIVNAAASRRSQQRHRFMLVSAAIVGVAVPLLLQHQDFLDVGLVRVGSGLLLLNLVVGAFGDALDEKRSTPLLVSGAKALEAANALAFAEDAKLISQAGREHDRDADGRIAEARANTDRAHKAMQKAGNTFANVSAVELGLFFGTFIVGVVFLLVAIGRT